MDKARRELLTTSLGLGAASALGFAFPALANVTFNVEQEAEIRDSARYTMLFASPYSSADWKSNPHMHFQLKKNIQEMSGGAIYVDIRDKGTSGVGIELMAQVHRGLIPAALISVSNLSPAAPALDILNIPFWSARNQDFVNLVTSSAWEKLIHEQIHAQRQLKILFYYVSGPRTVTSTKIFGETLGSPSDIRDILVRVPPSKTLRMLYQLAGARTVKVAWGDVARLAGHGRFDALDPSIVGLYNGPGGLRHQLGSISQIESVSDGWTAVVSQKWFDSLPLNLQSILMEAADKTFREHLQIAGNVSAYCETEFRKLGVDIYTPGADEKSEWIAQCGHQRSEWDRYKRRILGDKKNFDQLVEATRVNNGYWYGSPPCETEIC